jgi:ribosomal protein L9
MEIEAKLAEQGITIERKKFHLEEPIKKLGSYICKIRLVEDVEADLKIEVVKEGDEETAQEE